MGQGKHMQDKQRNEFLTKNRSMSDDPAKGEFGASVSDFDLELEPEPERKTKANRES